MRRRTTAVAAGIAAALAIVVTGCGGGSSPSSHSAKQADPKAKEVSPAGDIPDNQAYVAYAPPGGGFTVKVPEGWSRTSSGGAVTFTDKLNAIRVQTAPAQAPPTGRDARQTELPKLASSVAGYQPGNVSSVSRRAGTAIRTTYLADARANAVTGKAGKAGKDAVERYVFFHKGKDLILTLSGPKGADNVDPWRTVTDSVKWTR